LKTLRFKNIDNKKIPQLKTIYFYLTETCNLACRHCWINPSTCANEAGNSNLSFDHFNSALEQASPLGLKSVKLTGGEPLFHPDIKIILEALKNRNLQLTMETNGVLINREIAELISQSKKPFISVSIDGVKAETHEWIRGVKGSFVKAIRGIELLVSMGVKTQIIMTLVKRNKSQIADMIDLSEAIGVESIKFNVLQASGRAKSLIKMRETLPIEELVKIGHWVENDLSIKSNLKVFFDHPPAFQPLSRIIINGTLKCGVCTIQKIISVISNGSLSLCGVGVLEPDLIIGHINDYRLESLWKTSILLQQIRDGIPDRLEGVCGICIMKSVCQGGCMAQNYQDTKTLWSPFWFCQEAYDIGLFPESRIRPY
jgi:SynChlorMet cassette radical SAM/SPASM protein ScmF